jgi:hypothetical protein
MVARGLAAAAAVWMVGAAGARGAATFSLPAAADTFVAAAVPDGSFGAAGTLAVAAAGQPRGAFESLLRFELGPARADFDAQLGAGSWRLERAELRLTAAQPVVALFNAAAAGQFSLRRLVNDGWIEGGGIPGTPAADGLTWNGLAGLLAAGSEAVGTLAFGGANGPAVYELAELAGLRAELAAGEALSLHLAAADDQVSFLPRARQFQAAGDRPLLTLTAVAVPEPAGWAALAWGGLWAWRAGRRRAGGRPAGGR